MSEPTWMAIARSRIGVKEVAGDGDNPVIIGWAKALKGWIANFYTKDSIPWCGLFVDSVLTEDGKRTPGDKSLGALNWQGWGQALTKGIPGAIMVFKRLGGGHVGFYVAEDASAYHVLGGNQGDAVSITRIAKDRCVAIRWPYEVAAAGSPNVISGNDAPLSQNEA